MKSRALLVAILLIAPLAIGQMWESIAFAQVNIMGETPVLVSSLTAGNEASTLNDVHVSGLAAPGNRIYADITGGFDVDSIPADFVNSVYIRTKHADRATTGASLISLTLSVESQVCVWLSSNLATIAAWVALESYAILNVDISITSILFGEFVAYCANKSGAITLGGNTSDGDDSNPMYFVTIGRLSRQVQTASVPSGNGEYDFIAATENVAESTTQTIAYVTRTNGSSGAVSVDVSEAAGSTCAGADHTFTDPTTVNWATTIDGQAGGVSFTANAVSADCTVNLEFETAVGGISAGTTIQTETITIVNDTSPAGDYWVAKASDGGSDGNSCVQAQTEGTPKLTILAGISCMAAGDTLVVKAGTYTETSMIGNTIPNGTSWSNLSVVKINGSDVVTVNKPSGGSQWRPFFFGGSQTVNIKQYIEINGFIVDATGAADQALKIEGPSHHIRLQSNTFKNAPDSGVLFSNPTNWTESVGGHEFLDNITEDNGTDIIRDHGLYLTHDNSKVWGNIARNNAAFGIHVFQAGKDVDNTDIQYNTAHGNGKAGIIVDGHDNLIANNISYSNTAGGFVAFNGATNNKFYHNTNVGGAIGLRAWDTAVNNDFKNNISWGATSDTSDDGTGNTFTTNLFTDPTFVNEGTNDYHLQSGSGARSAGTNVLSDVPDDFDKVARDTVPDIGAYEFVP